MAANEINSFVYKFKNLWRNGQEANLNLKSKAGNAWVELSVCLGHPLDLPPPQLHRGDHESNSRSRRRSRRAAERLNKETKENVEKVENVESRGHDNAHNDTGIVKNLLNKDEELNLSEKDILEVKKGSSKELVFLNV